MEKLFLVFILAVLSNEALGMSYRYRRQSGDNEDDLEDRYGWNRPNFPGEGRFPPRPWRPNFPEQRPFPQQPQRPNFPAPNPNPTQEPTISPNLNPGQDQTQATPTPTPNSNGGSQVDPQACLRTCPVTSEYNPVCGTNNVTYDNPSRLFCAQACGVTVNLLRSSRCPAATTQAAPTA